MIVENELELKESAILAKKKILLFYPDFFGYDQAIKTGMEKLGAEVALYNSKSVRSAFGKAIFKICPRITLRFSHPYFQKIYEEQKEENLDFIVVVERLPRWFLLAMKKQHPKAKLVLYMDDSIKNLYGIRDNFDLFDIKCSFDKNDVERNTGILFRPLFFTKGKADLKVASPEKCRYDLCFIGTCHSDRYEILKEIQKSCNSKQMVFYSHLYLQSKFMFTYFKLKSKAFRHARIEEFSFEKMPYQKTINIENDSLAILDIQHPNQSGLTMRTIEMIGISKKLVTTNANIKNYDFYRPENICIIDRKNAKLDQRFLSEPYVELPESVYKKYSLRQWILDVLGYGGTFL